MVLNIDLNDLPAESREFEDDATPIELRHEQITILSSPGSFTSPIDADAIDEDVIFLSSSAWFSPAKSQSRRKRPITFVIDESLETNIWQTGSHLCLLASYRLMFFARMQAEVVEEPTTTLSLGIQKSCAQVPIGRIIIDCDLNANENCIPKMNKRMKPNPAAWKEASAPLTECTLTCPVCLCSLNEPSTTICGHLFCRSCIETAISKQKKCPTCRKKLTRRNFHRIYLP